MKRVMVTGIGVVTPLGNSLDALADGLLAGRSGAGPITLFEPARLATRIAAQVDTAGLPEHPDRKWSFALAASEQAMAGQTLDPSLGGLSLGIGLDLFSMPDLVQYLHHHGLPPGADPQTFLQTPSELCIEAISRRFNLSYPPQTHISACAASTDAIGTAFWTIRRGQRRWMLAGGSDSMINPMGVAGFCKIRATTTRNERPEQASRPFDRGRDGFLLGEGAAVLLLEEQASAQARGATCYGEVLGFGNSFDAHGISEPHPRGLGAVLAMRRALANAAVRPEQIAYVNAHGTSTPKNDPIETLALRAVFGAHAERLWVSSTKSMLGHLISASGAVEVAATLACARRGLVHPTINLEQPDPACDLDYIPEGPRPLPAAGLMLKNSFAFGGQNACLVLGQG
ncbi:MAG: beta-ketoacyl synthase [Vulcanimicrobiota bacterium]